MKKITSLLFVLLSFTILFSCTGSKIQSLSANEQKGLDEVRAEFDGIVNHKVSPSANGENGKQVFEISLSQSKVLEKYVNLGELAACNIAWLFFKNLQDEKSRYSMVKVNLENMDGTPGSFNFPADSMTMAMSKINVIEQAAGFLKAGNYDGLYALFEPEVAAGTTIEALKNYCSPYDAENGAITEFIFQGFAFFLPSSNKKELLQLSGQLKRSGKDTPLSIYVDPEKPEANGSMISIKFDY